ncbi:MAG: hypothetical protein C4542_06110 [Dehalococcoidia bacterium]|nr:MAG: hypothetical protein C4542_06110 [Dehalococcoidia bacterium]
MPCRARQQGALTRSTCAQLRCHGARRPLRYPRANGPPAVRAAFSPSRPGTYWVGCF